MESTAEEFTQLLPIAFIKYVDVIQFESKHPVLQLEIHRHKTGAHLHGKTGVQ